VVQAVNARLRISDRNGDAAIFVTLGDFFGTSSLPVQTFNAEPRVIYDALHGRWIATELSWDCDSSDVLFGHGYIDVLVSDTSDPTGAWSGYYLGFFDLLPAYPGVGTSTDKVAFTTNVFEMVGGGNCAASSSFLGTATCVADWTNLLNNSSGPASDCYTTDTDYFTPRAALQTPATDAAVRVVIQKLVSGSLDVAFWTITGVVGTGGVGGTSATEVDLTAANIIQDFRDPIPPRQPSGTIADAVDSRPTDAVWQNNRLTFVSTQACTPTGDVEPRDCVRVSQLNTSTPTPSLAQDFLIAQAGGDSYMGGIGHSANGGLFVAWTRSSATAGAFPSSYAAYQLPADPPNSLSSPELLAAGQANYLGSRWGDYVGVAQDPRDRNAVWQGNQYAYPDGWWGTFLSPLDTTGSGSTFVPVTPARLLDSRFGIGLSGPFSRNAPRSWQVAGLGGVPAGASAVTGNFTVTGSTGPGFALLGPDGQIDPPSSTINFPVGDNRANGVTVALSASGSLSATYSSPTAGATTHFIFDVTGYFVPDDSGATFGPLSPARLLDSRFGVGLSGPFQRNVPRTFQVTGVGGVPAEATAITGNVTVTSSTGPGFVFVGPNPSSNPTSSTINFPVGDNRANGVTVALSASGTLSATYSSPTAGATTHLIFDVTGYFVPDDSGATFIPLTPGRVLDTRIDLGIGGPFHRNVPRTFQVTGILDIVPAEATAVTGNVTVTSSTGPGFVFVGPNPSSNPASSTINFPVGDNRANGVTVALASDGSLSATYSSPTSGATTHLIFDVTGYFVDP
jgi:hypothetical protein